MTSTTATSLRPPRNAPTAATRQPAPTASSTRYTHVGVTACMVEQRSCRTSFTYPPAVDIAIVAGTGPMGTGLALRFAKAGHHVVVGSRSDERAVACADKIRERVGSSAVVEGRTNAEATETCEFLFVTVPFAGQAELYASLEGR